MIYHRVTEENQTGFTCLGQVTRHNIFYLGREAFIKNKPTMRRHRDLADLELLAEKP